MDIKEIMNEATKTAKSKGFGIRTEADIPKALCLIHSEISEALEEYRNPEMPITTTYTEGLTKQKPAGFTVELADALIRICHLADDLGLDLEEAIKVKMAYNKTRPHKHGKKC
ncbi:MAG: hypothetical protein KAJ07_00555 [Planctomycetes bacterium]|nr:hypothetical protein [Planctomycetota bacterium]